MQKISMTIRVDVGDLEKWRSAAVGEGVCLSWWIRKVLNGWVEIEAVGGSRGVDGHISTVAS